MDTGAADRELKIRALAEKLRLVHAKYMARYAELQARQSALLRDVLARIDRDEADKILSSIKQGTEKT